MKLPPLSRKPCWWLLASKNDPTITPELLMPNALVRLGAKGSSIVVKMLTGMLSPSSSTCARRQVTASRPRGRNHAHGLEG